MFISTTNSLQLQEKELSPPCQVEHAVAFFRKSPIQFDVLAKTYAILISGLAIVVKPEKAQKLFDEMIEKGVERCVSAYIVQIKRMDAAPIQEQLKGTQHNRGLALDATYGPFIA